LKEISRALIGSVLLAGLGASGCGGATTTPNAGDPAAEALTRGDFRRELLLTGELRAVNSISIKSPQTNIFQMRIEFMAEEGSFVEKGDPLLDFDNSALAEMVRDLESQIIDADTQIVTRRNALASALKDLEIELAEKQFEHDRAMLEISIDPDVLSRKEFGQRQFAYDKATRELEQTHEKVRLTRERGRADTDVLVINRDKLRKDLTIAQQGVDLLSIKAPADGLVIYERRQGTTLRYQEGDSCWPGQGIIRLPDLSAMQVEFNVNEVDAPLLAVKMKLHVSIDSFPGRELLGEIVEVPSMAVKRDETSKVAVFKVLADLSETWVGEMKPGMSTMGRVVVEERRNVPLVARSAVSFDGESYWLRAAGDGAASERERIEPIGRNETHYVLSEDEYARLTGTTEIETASAGRTGEVS